MSTYAPIATQTLGSAAASVTFSSIPQGYTDLVVVINAICASGGADVINLQYNGDSSSGLYSSTRLVGSTPTTVNSDRQTGANSIAVGLINSTVRNSDIYQIQNYSNTTTFKTCLARAGLADNQTRMTVGLWRNTNAITSITLSHASSINFNVGSTFSIYGIQVGDKAQKAQGGNIVTTDGTYVYHTFTSSGAFIPNSALTIDYLVVAGGGAGGRAGGGHGAGGAGGLRSTVTATGGGGSLETALSLTVKSYPVIVGAGGAQPSSDFPGNNGSNSVFSTIVSIGGGGGGAGGAGLVGGSGGGGSRDTNAGGAGTTNQGYAGGSAGAEANAYGGGGGGGAGAVGSNGTTSVGGNGGAGVAVSITGSSVTYAGGGGGGTNGGGFAAGTGGAGGGGNGSNGNAVAAQSGSANTGGGGGGGSNGLANNGNGGSGVVVIRYLA